eukprot:4549033-Prymnesium_polylepis.1
MRDGVGAPAALEAVCGEVDVVAVLPRRRRLEDTPALPHRRERRREEAKEGGGTGVQKRGTCADEQYGRGHVGANGRHGGGHCGGGDRRRAGGAGVDAARACAHAPSHSL